MAKKTKRNPKSSVLPYVVGGASGLLFGLLGAGLTAGGTFLLDRKNVKKVAIGGAAGVVLILIIVATTGKSPKEVVVGYFNKLKTPEIPPTGTI
jgi:hypothetical protein